MGYKIVGLSSQVALKTRNVNPDIFFVSLPTTKLGDLVSP